MSTPHTVVTFSAFTLLLVLTNSVQNTLPGNTQPARAIDYGKTPRSVPTEQEHTVPAPTGTYISDELFLNEDSLDNKHCPVVSNTARTVVDFTDNGTLPTRDITLRADASTDDARTERTIYIPPGTYRVESVSYGDRFIEELSRPEQVARNRWYANIVDENGSVLEETQTTRSVSPGEIAQEILVDSLELPGGVYTIFAHHDAYPSEDSYTVTPLCVVFARLDGMVESAIQPVEFQY